MGFFFLRRLFLIYFRITSFIRSRDYAHPPLFPIAEPQFKSCYLLFHPKIRYRAIGTTAQIVVISVNFHENCENFHANAFTIQMRAPFNAGRLRPAFTMHLGHLLSHPGERVVWDVRKLSRVIGGHYSRPVQTDTNRFRFEFPRHATPSQRCQSGSSPEAFPHWIVLESDAKNRILSLTCLFCLIAGGIKVRSAICRTLQSALKQRS